MKRGCCLTVALALVLSVCSPTAAEGVPKDPPKKAMRYVVPEAQVVFYADVASGRNLLRKMLRSLEKIAAMNEKSEILRKLAVLEETIRNKTEEITREIHIDPLKDLTSIVMSFQMGNDGGFSFLVVLRGNFDSPELKKKIYTDGSSMLTEYNGRKLLSFPIPQLRDGGSFFMTPTQMVAGNTPHVKAFIDGKLKGRGELAKRMKKSAPEKAILGMAVDYAALMGIGEFRTGVVDEMGEFANILNSLGFSSFWMTGKGATVVVQVDAPEAAERVHQTVIGLNELLTSARPIIRGLGYLAASNASLFEEELPPVVAELLQDNKTFLALVNWLSDTARISGSVKLSPKTNTVTWSLKGNLAGIGSVLLGAGAGAWYFHREAEDARRQELMLKQEIDQRERPEEEMKSPLEWIDHGAGEIDAEIPPDAENGAVPPPPPPVEQ